MKKRKRIHPIKRYSLETSTPISEIANFVDVTRVYISKIIAGDVSPSEKLCKKICHLVGCKWKVKAGKRVLI